MDRNARRRLNRFLANPVHNTKYSRLTKRDQARIREQIIAGDGRAARKDTAERDAARRAKEAGRSRFRRLKDRIRVKVDEFESLPDDERTRDEAAELGEEDERLFWDMYRQDQGLPLHGASRLK